MIRTKIPSQRSGAATVELAVLLPFLMFMFVITFDFARVFWYTTVATYMARDGALYGSANPTNSTDTTGIQAAADADDSFSSSNPFTVTSTTGNDAMRQPYVRVTVTYTFRTIMAFPGVPSSLALSRTCQMRVAQVTPN